MAIVIALAFGRSNKKPLPYNEFLQARVKWFECKENIVFTDLGRFSPPLVTIERAVKRAKLTGERKFILLAANNSYDLRVGRDLNKTLSLAGIDDADVIFDEVIDNYKGPFYSPDSIDEWTQTKGAWVKYNFKAYFNSLFRFEKYKLWSYQVVT